MTDIIYFRKLFKEIKKKNSGNVTHMYDITIPCKSQY